MLACSWFVPVAPVSAQNPPEPLDQVDRPQDAGKIIRAIRIRGASSPETIRRFLKTRVNAPLDAAKVRDDLYTLHRQLKVIATVLVEDAEDGGVNVIFVAREQQSYDRVVFRGLDHFKESTVRDLLDFKPGERVMELQAGDHQKLLEQRYRRDGYYWARVRLERDDETSTLYFNIDEGPEVTVGEVHFRGNTAFPGSAPVGLYTNLIGSAGLESEPPKLFSSSAFSEDAVEEDLGRLRRFYRSHGYRDAQVELADVRFSEDLSVVDLTIRVIEGRRYRIRNIEVVQIANDVPDPEPRFPKELLLDRMLAKPGDYYGRELVNHDKRVIEDFYGKRGHPISGRYGRRPLANAFEWYGPSWMQPAERYYPETAEVDLIFQFVEGTPKKLRDVVIRGNTATKDRIIRRKVFVMPGDTIDLTEVNRSLRVLDSLRYFQTPQSLAGVRFELLPVDDNPDEVDLRIDVHEGDTGSFLWGAGISTGAGAQARIQFTKRNFDIFRLPSSINPATIVSEVLSRDAFHGAGQELELFLAPGTQISTFRVSFYEPDLLGSHVDTVGLRLQAFRQRRILDSFTSDTRGAIVGLQRNFSEHVQAGLSVRQETADIKNISPSAPTIVWNDQGQTEIRSLQFRLNVRDVDNFLQPTTGHDLQLTGEFAGGFLGAEQDFYKLGLRASLYLPLYRDSRERSHVLFVRQMFDYGAGYSNTDQLYITERYYMGGSNLRGFRQRQAGPKQFGNPVGGQARYLSRVEYQFPLVSTRPEAALRENELLRGVLFSDWGLLGLDLDDPTFRQLRLSVGFGLRIHVPVLGVPIALDFGWPLVYQQTDQRNVFFFSLSRQ